MSLTKKQKPDKWNGMLIVNTERELKSCTFLIKRRREPYTELRKTGEIKAEFNADYTVANTTENTKKRISSYTVRYETIIKEKTYWRESSKREADTNLMRSVLKWPFYDPGKAEYKKIEENKYWYDVNWSVKCEDKEGLESRIIEKKEHLEEQYNILDKNIYKRKIIDVNK